MAKTGKVKRSKKKSEKPKKFYSEERFEEILQMLKSGDLKTKKKGRELIIKYLPLTTSIAKTKFFRCRALQMMNILIKWKTLRMQINGQNTDEKITDKGTKIQKAICKLKLALSSNNRFLRAQKDFPEFLKKLEKCGIEDDENILEQVDVKMATRIEMNEFAQWRVEENKKGLEPVFSGRAEYLKFSKVEKPEDSVLSGFSEDSLDSVASLAQDDFSQPSCSSSSISDSDN